MRALVKVLVNRIGIVAGVGIALALSSPASTIASVNFSCITFNWVNCNTLGPGFTATFSDDNPPAAPGQIAVTVTNANLGPVIAEIYFDDSGASALFTGIASIINGPGVAYSIGGAPPQLPSQNTAVPPFNSEAYFATANNPSPTN